MAFDDEVFMKVCAMHSTSERLPPTIYPPVIQANSIATT